MGLNSGDVVVAKIGDDLRMDYTAQGHTSGLAARMEEIAEPGHIYLTEHTQALAFGYFAFRALGPMQIKGVEQPVRVFDLEGPGRLRTRLDVSRARGFTRFVGRINEMRTLEGVLDQVAEGGGQIVGVMGEAGVGKSRLCSEFVERCRARGIVVLEAHCPAHGQTVPFAASLQILRAMFGIGEHDGPAEARQKVAGMLVLLDERFHASLPLMFDFLGIPDPQRPVAAMDPETRQRQLMALFREVSQMRAEQEVSITLFDDLHWVDPGSEDFLKQYADMLPTSRTLLLLNFRPEYDASWMQRSSYSQISLLPFGPDGISDLLAELLGDDPSLEQVKPDIAARASGNPFFVEELVLSLVEDGTLEGEPGAYRMTRSSTRLAIPATVQNILAARIDRIPEQDKLVLQSAAVVGRDFTDSLLARICEIGGERLAASLDRLANGEFIVARSLYPEAEYIFKHALTQEVAYGSQLSDRRRATHARVAAALEEIHTERLDERANLIAQHWEDAGQPMPAARWHARAAAWMGLRATAQAARHWSRVSELLAHVPETEETRQLELATAHWMLGWGWRVGISREEIRRVRDRASDLTTRSGDDTAKAQLATVAGMALSNGGDLSESNEQLEAALAIAERLGNQGLHVSAVGQLGNNAFMAGDYDRATELLERCIELTGGNVDIGREVGGFSPTLIYLGNFGWQCVLAGELDRAEQLFAEGRRLSIAAGDEEGLAITAGYSTERLCALGDLPAARTTVHEYLECAERIGNAAYRGGAQQRLGQVSELAGDWDAAVDAYGAGVREFQSARLPLWEAQSLAGLSRALLETNDLAGAMRAAEAAAAVSADFPELLLPQIEARIAMARVRLRSGDTGADTRRLLDEAAELVERTGTRLLAPIIAIERAELARRSGDTDTKERHLEEARRLYRAMGISRLPDQLGG